MFLGVWAFHVQELACPEEPTGAVVIKRAMNLSPGGQAGVDARRSKEVQADQGLREKTIPQMKREVAIRGTKTRNEVVLEGLDSAFRRVPAVNMRRCELEVNFLLFHELLQGGGGSVVVALEDGFEAT